MHLLIVDDATPCRQALVDCFSAAGYRLATAATPAEARAAVAICSPDVVIVGTGLEHRDTIRLCAAVRERVGGEVLIVVLAANNAPLRRVTLLQLGADDVISLPCSADELLARIEAHRRRITGTA